jgi:hypothetical protein
MGLFQIVNGRETDREFLERFDGENPLSWFRRSPVDELAF